MFIDDDDEEHIFQFERPVGVTAIDRVDFERFQAKVHVETTQLTHDAVIKQQLSKENDAQRHKTVPPSIARAIAKGRVSVGMTQKQLATRVNMDSARIAAIEAATAVYNSQELMKIRKFLGLPKWDA